VRVPRVHAQPGLKLDDPGLQPRDLLSLHRDKLNELLV
jgi:hypothetical protein